MMINPNMILNAVYPVGSLYLTTNDINPSTFLGGTWEKITADAYLKIVTTNAGELGGTSSDHKIKAENLPPHRHPVRWNNGQWGVANGIASGASTDWRNLVLNPDSAETGLIAHNQNASTTAYYPYYYGIYVFRRTA